MARQNAYANPVPRSCVMRRTLLPILIVALSSLVSGQSISSFENGKAQVTLLSSISSRLPKNSAFRARLDTEVQSSEFLLAPGTIFEGRLEPTAARRMIRSGALRLVFDRMVLPDGSSRPVSLTLTSVHDMRMKIDSEGTIRPRRSKKRLLLQVGGTLMIAKLADDISEVGATSVTKGLARFIGWGAGAGFVLLQKGSEVRLPEGTHLHVTFGRDGEVLKPGFGAASPDDSASE
jgi:hypothetical protein